MCYCKFSHEYFRAVDGVWAYDCDGEKHFVSSKAVKVCGNCGEVVVGDGFLEDNNGRIYCQICQEDECYACQDCGDIIFPHEARYHVGDGCICSSCRDENYIFCDRCNALEHNDCAYRTEDGYDLCEHCWENYTTFCEECDRRFLNEDNMVYDEENECYLCKSCYENTKRTINNYSFKPNPIFLKLEKDGKNPKEFFGFEIEVEGDKDKAYDFLLEFGDIHGDNIYLKHDGSVEGFEIVTHPMTRNYYYEAFKDNLEKGMRFLAKKGFSGHNCGGIHIHVSKNAISDDQLAKLVILLYPKTIKVYRQWLAITQRKERKMEEWSTMDPDRLDYGKRETVERAKSGYTKINDERRYHAINTQNNNTIEFRIFNSNLRIERITKNAEVIFSLLDFTNTSKLPTMTNYLNFVCENKEKYMYLYNFLLEKKIWQTKEQKEATKEIIKVIRHTSGKQIDKDQIIDYLNELGIVDFSSNNNDDEKERSYECALPF